MEKGKHILEVKYDEVLPAYIAQALETGRLQQRRHIQNTESAELQQKHTISGGML